MNPPLPSQIQIRIASLRHNARYTLPERPAGKVRWLGLVPVLFGCAFAGFAAFWISMAVLLIFRTTETRSLLWFFPLFGLPFVLAGIGIIRTGAFILAGRVEVEVIEGQLRATERAWFFWKRHTVRTDKLRRLSVEALRFDLAHFTGAATKLATLRAEPVEGKPLELVRGYPLEWLEPLARELARQCVGLNAAPLDVDIVTEPPPRFNSNQTDQRDTPHQPAGSRVHLAERPDGLTLIVPAAGLVRGSKGLFVVAIIWDVFISVGTAIFLFADKSKKPASELVSWLIISIFWLAGAVLMVSAINMGRRRAAFMVEGDQLRIAHSSLFGTKMSAWSREELKSIHIGPSSMAMNDVPVLELQIEPCTGKKVGLFAGREEEELRWIATTLRQSLHLKTKKDPS